MIAELFEARERIHRKANRYFTLQSERWDLARWRLFYGATDALLDASEALTSLRGGLPIDQASARLACYGFLQAIYVQQDSIRALWEALEIEDRPLKDAEVTRLRELRDRVVGHPARADRGRQKDSPSSSIIVFHMNTDGCDFQAILYFDGDFQNVPVKIQEAIEANARGLLPDLKAIENAMDEKESAYRKEEALKPLSTDFENGLGYALEKLRSPLGDGRRDMALRMLSKSCEKLSALLESRGHNSDATRYHLATIREAIVWADEFDLSPSPERQARWDVLSSGIIVHVSDLQGILNSLDHEFSESVG